MDTNEKFYTIIEVADKLNLSQKTIRRHIAAGALISHRIGGVHRITDLSFNKFLEKPKEERPYVGLNLFGEKIYLNEMEPPKYKLKKQGDIINWVDVVDDWKTKKKSKLTTVDLFCGAGGISKGFELAGLNGICGLDWFDAAGETYRRNFKHPFVYGDISKQETKKEFYSTIKKQLKGRKVNIVAGGFPCQGFSMAGSRVVDDPRNSLYKEMLEIVKKLKPDFVVCENVVGLRNMLGGKIEQKILEDYKEAGYEMNVTTLRAADYSVPQKRDRVIFIGNRIGLKNFHPKPFLTEENYQTTRNAIEDLMNLPEDKEFNHLITKHQPEMEKRLLAIPEGKSLYANYSDAWKKCPWNEASCTIKENHGGVNVHPKLGRVLTPREMARIQSFPDDFIFEGGKSKQLVQIGNAVPPLLAKAIGLAIRKSYGEL